MQKSFKCQEGADSSGPGWKEEMEKEYDGWGDSSPEKVHSPSISLLPTARGTVPLMEGLLPQNCLC